MKDQEKYFTSRIEYETPTSVKDIEPAGLLPDWIENLQQYFGKKHITNDTQNQQNHSYFRKGKI